jgi:amino acid transporter
MLRFIILLLITIVLVAFVAAGTNVIATLLLQNLAEQIGSAAFLIVFTITLLVFLVFFVPAFRRAGDETKIETNRQSWDKRLKWLLYSIAWVAAATFVISSFKVVLQVSHQVHPNLFWSLFVIFMIILFVTAYLEDKKEKRLRNNRAAWWK